MRSIDRLGPENARYVRGVRATFKDAETVTRLNGKPAIAIEVKPANIPINCRAACGNA